MSVRSMRQAFVVFVITLIAIAVAGFMLYRYAIGYPTRPADPKGHEVELVLPQGANFRQVTTLLRQKGLITSPLAFRVYALYKKTSSKVRAGKYKLSTRITPKALLETLVRGAPSPTVPVTIPEGKHMLEVARIIANAKVAPYAKLVEAMRNPRLLKRLGVPSTTMEGFLFPDTYRFKAPTRIDRVLQVLYRKHKRVFVRLRKKHAKKYIVLRDKLGWGHKEIVTMASIVEKETGQSFERPLIAGVFINRLRFSWFQPKLLQTDPTIIYGCVVPEEKSAACKRFKGRIRRIHLNDKDNPYSTYTHIGLPPGPISNPGRAAIEAVFNPKKHRYLYFVAKNDGTHYFSKNRAEHERAVDKYQRNYKRKK